MRAVVYSEFRGPVQVSDVADPEPGPGEVVVEVKATGVCRSDWHGWRGHDSDIRAFPHVPGHELAGVIHSVGEEISGWSVGDRVTVPFVAGCGACDLCRSGSPHVCPHQVQPGFTHWGSFAELVTIRYAQSNLVRIPESFGFAETAALGCRFSTAYRAVAELGGLERGDWVAVHGCGGVGLSAVMVASALGAQVIAVDPNPRAVEFALSMGASQGLQPGPQLASQLLEMSDGGVVLSVDAIGHEGVVRTSIDSLRPGGRHIQVGLLPGRPVEISMARVIAKELMILGSHGVAAASFQAIFDLIASSDIDLQQMVAEELSLEGGAQLLEHFDQRTAPGIAVITSF